MAWYRAGLGSSGGSGGIDLLWSHSNPAGGFDAQTLQIDLTDYAAIVVEGSYDGMTDAWQKESPSTGAPSAAGANSSFFDCRQFINKGDSGYILFGVLIPRSTSYVARSAFREVSTSNSGIVFGAGTYHDRGSASYTTSKFVAVPVKIYGISGTLPS